MSGVSPCSRSPTAATGTQHADHTQSPRRLVGGQSDDGYLAGWRQQVAGSRQRRAQVHVMQARHEGDEVETPRPRIELLEGRARDLDVLEIGDALKCAVGRLGIGFDARHRRRHRSEALREKPVPAAHVEDVTAVLGRKARQPRVVGGVVVPVVADGFGPHASTVPVDQPAALGRSGGQRSSASVASSKCQFSLA